MTHIEFAQMLLACAHNPGREREIVDNHVPDPESNGTWWLRRVRDVWKLVDKSAPADEVTLDTLAIHEEVKKGSRKKP